MNIHLKDGFRVKFTAIESQMIHEVALPSSFTLWQVFLCDALWQFCASRTI